MRIFLDITHPADVHFFRHPIRRWLDQRHEVQVVARDKDVAQELLALFRIPFRPLGRAGRGLLGLTLELARRESAIYRILREGRCDVACGFGATFLVHAARVLGIPTVVFTDCENAHIANRLTFPFATLICTPRCYRDDLGFRHRRFNGYKELAYLHPTCFTPDRAVLRQAGLREDEPFVFVRLTAWSSGHDFHDHGLTNRRAALLRLQRFGRVVVSVEGGGPVDGGGLRFNGPLHQVHHLLAFARLFFGESATMAAESAMLGTPAVLVSTSRRGYTDDLEKRYGMVFTYDHPRDGQERALRKAEALLRDPDTKRLWQEKRQAMLAGQEDITRYVTDLVTRAASLRGRRSRWPLWGGRREEVGLI
jgi:predicted glycosyltransferase